MLNTFGPDVSIIIYLFAFVPVLMYIDNESYEGNMQSRLYGLELSEPLYIGGVPNYNEIAPAAEANRGFVGG